MVALLMGWTENATIRGLRRSLGGGFAFPAAHRTVLMQSYGSSRPLAR
jgi:hypothetical protein